MGQVVGFEDRTMGRGNFGGKYGPPHCNQWGLFTIGNSHCAADRLLFGEFLELQARRAGEPRMLRPSALWLAGPATRPSCHVTVGRLVRSVGSSKCRRRVHGVTLLCCSRAASKVWLLIVARVRTLLVISRRDC